MIMGNMSYCRFENTVQDLKDCYDNIDETDDLNSTEIHARKRLIKICIDIACDYAYEVGKDVAEI